MPKKILVHNWITSLKPFPPDLFRFLPGGFGVYEDCSKGCLEYAQFCYAEVSAKRSGAE